MVRIGRALAVIGVVALALAACDSGSDSGSESGESDGGGGEAATTTTTTPLPPPIDDQTPPVGANGIADAGDGSFWVADLAGGELLRVDATSGAILARFGEADGLTAPDDVAIADDGSVYYTGLNDGVVGRVTTEGDVEVVAEVPVGVNPITLTDDGRLFVGLEVDAPADAIYEIDLTGDTEPRLVGEDMGRLNAFDVGPDGFLYGPGFGLEGAGTLVRVDVETGETEVITDGFGYSVSVRFGEDGTAYVAQTAPPKLWSVDLETREMTEVATPSIPLVDNFAITDDGFALTAFNAPTIELFGPDGTSEGQITIGSP